MTSAGTTTTTNLTATLHGATCASDPDDSNNKLGLLFDGVNDYVELDSFEFGGITTIEMYLKLDEYNGNGVILDFGSNGSDSFSIGNQDELIAMKYFGPASTAAAAAANIEYSTSHFSQKAWDHLVLTIAADGIWTLYKNGNEVDSRQQSIPSRTTRGNHGLGNLASNPTDNWFQGIIGFLKIYKGYR